MESSDSKKTVLPFGQNVKLKIIFEGIIVGAFSGLLIVLYRYTLEKLGMFCKYIYGIQHIHPWFIPVWILILIIAGLFVGFIVSKEPMASGGGVQQTEGVLLGKLSMNWWRVILVKFIGGAVCIGAGLSLGREGPSVQMGAAVGQGIGRIFKRTKAEERLLITSGASAGLSAAFSAPLTGTIFALEEINKSFSPLVMANALAASITADFVSKDFFGMKPMLSFKSITQLPLNRYLYIIVLGIILGLFGVVFNNTLIKTQDLYAKQKWLPKKARPIIPFAAAGVLGLFLPEVLGDGHGIIASVSSASFTLKMLLLILIVKFLFTMLSYGSSAPGGTFVPVLAIGAAIGALYGSLLHIWLGFDTQYIVNLVALAMAGYFAAVVKTPITGCLLITEITGSFTHLLSIAVVCLTAYVVMEAVNQALYMRPYLRGFLRGQHQDPGVSHMKLNAIYHK